MEPDSSQQPGQVIKPADSASAEPSAEAPEAAKVPETPVPSSAPHPAAKPEPADTAETEASEEENPPAEIDDLPTTEAITWTASEFIAHKKSLGWYLILAASALLFAAIVYMVSRDYVSVIVILVAALLLAIYGTHKPKQLEYRLDSRGLNVGPRHFGYGQFKSFSVLAEGAFSSIVFMPLKRFAVPTTIYYPPEDEDKIVGMLSDRLPLEKRDHDAIDKLMHRIRY